MAQKALKLSSGHGKKLLRTFMSLVFSFLRQQRRQGGIEKCKNTLTSVEYKTKRSSVVSPYGRLRTKGSRTWQV
jgi:hypothetical protein